MDVTVRPVAPSDVPALQAMHSAQNDFGGRWFVNPFAGGTEVPKEGLSPAQRWLHGGPWMDPQLLALHLRRYEDAGGIVLVAEREGAIVGSIELWPAEEPLPLGVYLDVEMLIAEPPGEDTVERALLIAAVQEARGRDVRNLDIAPLHAGGTEALLRGLGFRLLVEHRTIHLPSDGRPKPPPYDVVSTAPAYGELRDFVSLDHREPATFRLGNLGNEWAAGLLRDVSHPFAGLLRVAFAPLGVAGRVLSWLPDREADFGLWLPTTALGNLPWFQQAVAAALDYVSKRHRVALYRTTVPAHLVDPLREIGFEDGDEPDPWLRKHLTAQVLSHVG